MRSTEPENLKNIALYILCVPFFPPLHPSFNPAALCEGVVRDKVWEFVWAGLPSDLKAFLRTVNAALKGKW